MASKQRSNLSVTPDLAHKAAQRRFPPGARVAYSFGEAAPLATESLVPLLVGELNLMIGAFEAYRELVDEHTTPLET